MYLFLKNHNHLYSVKSLILAFYPNTKIELLNELELKKVENSLFFVSEYDKENKKFVSIVYNNGNIVSKSEASAKDINDKNSAKRSIYDAIADYLKVYPKWGILTGIRPSKIIYGLLHKSDEEIINRLKQSLYVDEEKAKLAVNVARNEKKILDIYKEEGYHIYIGIPFCKSKCSYCSFTSFSIDKYKKNGEVDIYVDCLIEEIQSMKYYADGKTLKTLYFGGGTPSTLTVNQIEKIMDIVRSEFDLSNLLEFTFEAGRVDTITEEKLLTLKKYNVSRISLNCQTMNDKTLEKIGRTHTAMEFIKTYELARQLGFDNINVDLIIGLEGETLEDFKYTLNKVLELNPESITVHTLAIKKGGKYKYKLDSKSIFYNNVTIDMGEYALNTIEKNEYLPYYMYRQKNMVGQSSLENIGFSKNGAECIYNIVTMEEQEEIIAFGAGVTSKVINDDGLNRIFNVSGVEEYIHRIDEMIQRKKDAYAGGNDE